MENSNIIKSTKSLKRPLSLARAAMEKYDMVQKGDHIAVGVSGGKDSMLLLAVLASLKNFYKNEFEVTAVTIDPCFNGEEADYSLVTKICDELKVNHIIKRTALWEVVFNERKESNPCGLCSKMRRGLLHNICSENNFNVIALGHHKEDAAETFLMNLLVGGTIKCFSPKSYLSRREIHMIRPLIFMNEREIINIVKRMELPIVKSCCPVDGITQRAKTRSLIDDIGKNSGFFATKTDIAEQIISAMRKNNVSDWG